MKVLCYVGSLNPVKTGAVFRALSEYTEDAEVIGVDVASGVPAQPLGEETFRGAFNRATSLRAQYPAEEDMLTLYMGIEGGVMELHGTAFAFGCVSVTDAAGKESNGTSALFPLPPAMAREVKNRKELGEVIDELSGQVNSKQQGGAIGFLTGNVITREELYYQGVIAALTPFIHSINPVLGADFSLLQ